MGAWGIGNFENDEASDWVWDLVKSKDKDFLHETLARAVGGELSNSSTCAEALAAAEVTLAGLNKEADNLPDEAADWLNKGTGLLRKKVKVFGPQDAILAQEAVQRISSSSELLDLWIESGNDSEWLELQNKLSERLASHA